ncbi:phosphotransferase [Nocardiopsis sp. NPDC006198]|uniref:phosphotransferase n=1 Tax=Nocardiopsis sp. NPDC006198 TaxID=3154472 RepID=UPI0033AB9850
MANPAHRLGWDDVPDHLTQQFTDRFGAPVTDEQRQAGGFSPGLASRLRLADGQRVFAKAIHTGRDPHTPGLYRREIQVTRTLPAAAPAPQLRWTYDDGDWVMLVFDDVDGHTPAQPWRQHDLDRVVAALADMADALTPAPADTVPATEDLALPYASWSRLSAGQGPARTEALPAWARDNLALLTDMEKDWAEAADGDTLAHTDLRADNMILTPERVVLVDWPYAVAGAPWLDLLMMLPSVAAYSTIDPEQVWSNYRHASGVEVDAVNAVLAAIAGDYLTNCQLPDPPNIPTLRPHQRAKGEATLRWLHTRLEI